MAAVLVALIYSCIILQTSSAEYYVRPNSSSLNCPASSELCLTLDDYVSNAGSYFTTNATFMFLEGEHYMNGTLSLANVTNISLTGVNTNVAIVILEGSGFSFIDSVGVVLTSLHIQKKYSLSLSQFLLVHNSDMIEIVNVTFSMNSSSRAVYFNEATASVTNCSFFSGHAGTGGAIYSTSSSISFLGTSIFENNRADIYGGAITFSNSSASFSGNSTFQNNTAGIDVGDNNSGGGAVSVIYSNVSFSGASTFSSNFARFHGGAIEAIVFSRVIFSGENTFLNNKVVVDILSKYASGGGALYIVTSIVELTGVNKFERNKEDGVYSTLGGAILAFDSTLQFNNYTDLKENLADVGGGLACINSSAFFFGTTEISSNKVSSGDGGGVHSYKSSLYYQGNTNFSSNIARRKGAGIYLYQSTVEFQENVIFEYNSARELETLRRDDSTIIFIHSDGGGVYAYDSIVTVSGIANFTHNSAYHGGGIFVDHDAELVLQSPISMNFHQNLAFDSGGALYLDDFELSSLFRCLNISLEVICAFGVENTNTSFQDIQLYFVDNFAHDAGSIIFGGDLEHCKLKINDSESEISGKAFLSEMAVPLTGSQESVSFVTSGPLKLCFCEDGHPVCDYDYAVMQVPRGKIFDVSLVSVGQLDMPVPSQIISYLAVNESSDLIVHNSNSRQISQCQDFGFSVHTKVDSEFLVLHPIECSSETASLIVKINFIDCPPGFILIDEDHCECEKRLQDLGMICDLDSGLIRRPNGSRAWIQPIVSDTNNYSGFLWNSRCSSSSCRTEDGENPIWLNFSESSDSDNQCLEFRTGLQCGACKEGYSLTLGTRRCEKCSNRYISLLIFFAFSGIALIAVLLALHMTVAAGTINGLILYANAVNICRSLFFRGAPPNVLTVFIAWLNLDFGIPLCFYDGLDAYAYFWLQYAYPFYLWTLIGLIFLVNRISSRVGRLFGSNPVAVLATVILLSFTKLLENIVRVLATRPLEYPDGTRNFWRADPNLPFFQGKHAVLATFSIVIMIFLMAPYIFVLLFGYRLQAYSGRKGFNWLNKLKPFLDAYYAPFKKSARYWPGLLLLVRSSIFLSLTPYIYTANVSLVLVSSMFTGVAIIPWLNGRLYEKLYLDILESSFMLNLLILFNVTVHVQALDRDQNLLSNLLVGIAFVEFIGIVLLHLIFRIGKKLINLIRFRENRHLKALKERLKVKEPNAKPPVTTTVVTIREPLLEDSL